MTVALRTLYRLGLIITLDGQWFARPGPGVAGIGDDLRYLSEDRGLGTSGQLRHFLQAMASDLGERFGINLATDIASLDERVVDVPQDKWLRTGRNGTWPSTVCMPCTAASSDAVAQGPVAAGQGSVTVRGCRAGSAGTWGRSHYLSHWVPRPPG